MRSAECGGRKSGDGIWMKMGRWRGLRRAGGRRRCADREIGVPRIFGGTTENHKMHKKRHKAQVGMGMLRIDGDDGNHGNDGTYGMDGNDGNCRALGQ